MVLELFSDDKLNCQRSKIKFCGWFSWILCPNTINSNHSSSLHVKSESIIHPGDPTSSSVFRRGEEVKRSSQQINLEKKTNTANYSIRFGIGGKFIYHHLMSDRSTSHLELDTPNHPPLDTECIFLHNESLQEQQTELTHSELVLITVIEQLLNVRMIRANYPRALHYPLSSSWIPIHLSSN